MALPGAPLWQLSSVVKPYFEPVDWMIRNGLDTGFLVAAEMEQHPKHAIVRACRQARLANGETFVLVPSVVSEFVHVVTDAKRFDDPLPMATARRRAREWWSSAETEQLHTDDIAMECFFDWHEKYRLGRKRLHDTMLAATLYTAGVTSLLTLNSADFRIFDCFEFHPDLTPPALDVDDAQT